MPENKATEQSAQLLLKADQESLVHWLHDDLGQNLVAIKSFAGAIIEQNSDATDDTAELAEIIKQAADSAYRATYDLMQELRAQDLADQPISAGLTNCLDESRLKEKQIALQLEVDPNLNDLDTFTKAAILRSTRSFINFSKRSKQAHALCIELRQARSVDSEHPFELMFSHQGEFDVLPGEAPGLSTLKKRIEAIGGIVILETNDLDELTMKLYLKRLSAEGQ